MKEEIRPPEPDNIVDVLLGRGAKPIEQLPTAEESAELCGRLNRQLDFVMGKTVEIDCGSVYFVGDGKLMGGQSLAGNEIGDKYTSGIKFNGALKRFDVLEIRDQLISRGTEVIVPEPCLVVDEVPHFPHRIPEPDVAEAYVPIIRLSEFKIKP